MNEQLELHPNFSYRVDVVGNEKEPVLIVDNFLNNPEMLIEYAKTNCEFNGNESGGYYPGVRAKGPDVYIKALVKFLGPIILETFYGERIKAVRPASFFSMVVTPPEKLSPLQCIPHFDSSNYWDLATVHYLSQNKNSGTSLYRHRATGFESVRLQRTEKYFTDVIKELENLPSEKKYMNGSNENFEQIGSYDSEFNRIVIYRCTNLHSGNISNNFNFDPDPNTGRLTLNTFLYTSKDATSGLSRHYLSTESNGSKVITTEANVM